MLRSAAATEKFHFSFGLRRVDISFTSAAAAAENFYSFLQKFT
jgi:hypothetical protein